MRTPKIMVNSNWGCFFFGLQYISKEMNNYKNNNRKNLRGKSCMQPYLFQHFQSPGHFGFVRDAYITLINQTDQGSYRLIWQFFHDFSFCLSLILTTLLLSAMLGLFLLILITKWKTWQVTFTNWNNIHINNTFYSRKCLISKYWSKSKYGL